MNSYLAQTLKPLSPAGFGSGSQPVIAKLPIAPISLALVVLIHIGALALMFYSSAPEVDNTQLPTIQGILIPAPPAEAVQAPSAQQAPPPTEMPPELTKLTPKKVAPKSQPKPTPIAKAPVSEKAITH
jgi:protein TonB